MPARVAILHDEAGRDYDAAFEWYLEQSADAVVRLDAPVQRAMDEIGAAPQRWVRWPYDTRRFLLRGSPYLLIYRELSQDVVQVLALAHTSRRPGYWRERV